MSLGDIDGPESIFLSENIDMIDARKRNDDGTDAIGGPPVSLDKDISWSAYLDEAKGKSALSFVAIYDRGDSYPQCERTTY